jgi:hypothetical protein
MLLGNESSEYTSFTVHPLGQFKFTKTSQGIASATSNFHRMIELAMIGLNNVIVCLDDLPVHTKTHSEHWNVLEKIFSYLRKCNLKLNLSKFHLCTQTVDYVVFSLTPIRILPKIDQ